MGWALLVAALAYAVVSTFGAWSVVHRSRGLVYTFLASAATLTVGGVAAAYRLPESAWLLLAGAAIGSFASIWNARRVLKTVNVLSHVGRGLYGVALVVLAIVAFV